MVETVEKGLKRLNTIKPFDKSVKLKMIIYWTDIKTEVRNFYDKIQSVRSGT